MNSRERYLAHRRDLKRRRALPIDLRSGMVLEPKTQRENEMNTIRNIRLYLSRMVGLACLFAVTVHGGSANVSCTVPGGVATLRLLVGQTPGVWTRTNSFLVSTSALAQSVTNLLTNLPVGTNYIAGQVISTSGLASDISTNIQVVVPAAPDSIQTVPLSLVVPVGVPIQISRDGINFQDRILISEVPNPAAFTATAQPGSLSPAGSPVSAVNGNLVLVTYRTVADQPQLFFRQQPPPNQPPTP